MNKKGFVISTTLYSIFGIMLLTVFYILYLLANNRLLTTTNVNEIKEELNKPDEYIILPLAEAIITNETPKEETVTFSSKSYDSGLYKKDTEIGKISFFKGDVTNNYVEFGTYKSDIKNEIVSGGKSTKIVKYKGDPIVWRILRINEDNSVTLLLENDIGTPIAWSSSGSVTYKGSDIESAVNKWYTETFIEEDLDNLVQQAKFCNDRSYGALSRIGEKATTYSPKLNCNTAYIVNNKAGLLTADEMVYAGAYWYNTSVGIGVRSYISNKTYFWTMTPYSSTQIFEYSPSIAAFAYDTSKTNFSSARPVITISSLALALKGNGTLENPYKVGVLDE